MATRVQCINKTSRSDPHERIQAIGGLKADGTRWALSEPRAIAGIESGRWRFYVLVGGRRVDVIVAPHRGHKYLKTRADAFHPNNLLALPECPRLVRRRRAASATTSRVR